MSSTERVSLRDIYEAVNNLEDKMIKRIEKIESNVDSIQSFQNRLLGMVSLLSLFGSALATFIWQKIISG